MSYDYNPSKVAAENVRLVLAEQVASGATAALYQGVEPSEVLVAKALANASKAAGTILDAGAAGLAVLASDTQAEVLSAAGAAAADLSGEPQQTALDQRDNDQGFVGLAVSGTVTPLLLDEAGRVALALDNDAQVVVGMFRDIPPAPLVPLDTADRPILADYNQIIFYGQSNSIGAQGRPLISTTQPFTNLTWDVGPKASYAPTGVGTNDGMLAFKPLVEDLLDADGGGNRGETNCSGCANFVSRLRAIEDGDDPDGHVILASAAGKGSSSMAELEEGSTWYELMEDHISRPIVVAAGGTVALHCVGWDQGEADVSAGTSRASYLADVIALQDSITADAIAANGQTIPVHMLLVQTSFGVRTSANIALAQLDAVMTDPHIHLVCPTYFLPFNDDLIHCDALGHFWKGHYFGRAYKRLVIDGVVPPQLLPISATATGTELRIRFSVPARPLVLDINNLLPTTDHGFKVTDGTGTLTLNKIYVDKNGTDVVIELNRALGSSPVVRYALDYLATGLLISQGGSGNLRDSAPEFFTYSANRYNLWNWSPAFELPVYSI